MYEMSGAEVRKMERQKKRWCACLLQESNWDWQSRMHKNVYNTLEGDGGWMEEGRGKWRKKKSGDGGEEMERWRRDREWRRRMG